MRAAAASRAATMSLSLMSVEIMMFLLFEG
jgi:hypothetical protein